MSSLVRRWLTWASTVLGLSEKPIGDVRDCERDGVDHCDAGRGLGHASIFPPATARAAARKTPTEPGVSTHPRSRAATDAGNHPVFPPSGQLNQGGPVDHSHILVHHQLDPTLGAHRRRLVPRGRSRRRGPGRPCAGLAEPVSVDRFSCPFTSTGFVVAQATFALQHAPLAIGVAATGCPRCAHPAPPGSGSSELSSAWRSSPCS